MAVVCFIVVFSAQNVSGAEFDNAISNYDEATQTVTFKNGCIFEWTWTCLGSEIGQVRLITPLDYGVAQGYNYVWEIEAEVYNEDYNDFLKGLEYIDLNDEKKSTSRELDIKILSYEDVEKPTYDRSCVMDYSNSTNGTEVCSSYQNGTKMVVEEVWTKVTPADLKRADGKARLRGYVDVRAGDKIDWSAEFFGVRVGHDIWATWTESLNTDLIFYGKMDDDAASTAVDDSTDTNEGTLGGGDNTEDKSVPGIINTGLDMDGILDYINLGTMGGFGSNFDAGVSYAFWMKTTDTGPGRAWGTQDDSGQTIFYMSMNLDSAEATDVGKFVILLDDDSGNKLRVGLTNDETWSDGAWHHIAITIKPTTSSLKIYIDGAIKPTTNNTQASQSNFQDFTYPFYIGGRRLRSTVPVNAPYDAAFDEFGIWNREISAAEVTQLWNGGSGISWGVFGTAPSVTLTSPANNSNLTSANVDHVAIVTDDILVENVTLYLDGVANQTNTSHFNGSYTFTVEVDEGVHTWSILAYNNQSLGNQSANRTYNYTMPPLAIDLLSPTDTSTHQTPTVNVTCVSYDPLGVIQLNLTIDGVVNQSVTNSTPGQNLTAGGFINFSEANYTWGCSAYNSVASSVSSNRTFQVLYSNPVVILLDPDNATSTTNNNVTFVANATDLNGVANVTFYLDGAINQTNTSGISGNYSFVFAGLPDAVYSWKVGSTSILGKETNSTPRQLIVHTVVPEVSITAPTGVLGTIKIGENETLDYAITESGENLTEHIDTCWYEYGSSNYCYQESANTTNQTGIDGDCGLNYSGSYQNNMGCSLFNDSIDGNWTTFCSSASSATTTKHVDINYIKPANVISADYTVKTTGGSNRLLQCSDGDGYVNIGFLDPFTTGPYDIPESCLTGFVVSMRIEQQLFGAGLFFFEEAINWTIGTSLNCSASTVDFLYQDGFNNLTVFAQDTFGLIATNTTNWSYLLVEGVPQFEANVSETSRQEFAINMTTVPSVISVGAILNYNGTRYTADSTCSSGVCQISTAIDVPLVSSGNIVNHTWFFELEIFTATLSTNSNTTNQIQTVNQIFFAFCNSTINTQVLNFTAFDEITLAAVAPFDYNADYQYWLGTGTVYRNESFIKTNNSIQMCVIPSDKDFKITGIVEYDEASGTNYTVRNYFFDNDTVNNNSQDIELGLLLSSEATSFILRVQDKDLLPVSEVLIFTQRFYPGLGIFKTVQVSRTDDNGQTVGFFEVETADYRFILKQDGTTVLVTNEQKVVGEDVPFTLTFTIGVEQGSAWEPFEEPDNLVADVIWNKSTSLVNFEYSDTGTTFGSARLIVEKVIYNSSTNLEVCDISQSQASGVISCNMTGNATGTYIARGLITRDGVTNLAEQIQFQIEDFSTTAGLLGLLLGWFVILVCAFMFKFNEIAGIVMVNLAIIGTNMFGLIAWGYAFISASIALSIIILVVLER